MKTTVLLSVSNLKAFMYPTIAHLHRLLLDPHRILRILVSDFNIIILGASTNVSYDSWYIWKIWISMYFLYLGDIAH